MQFNFKFLLAIVVALFSTMGFASTPFIGIAAGTYTVSPGPFYPFVATANDNGLTWNYPRGVLDNLQTVIDPSFVFGLLRGATCTGEGNNSVCVALGSFCKTDDCTSQVPLVALGKDRVNTWTFPSSVFDNLTTKIDPNFARGFFINGSCLGKGNNAICVAAGMFTNPLQHPLVGLTTDGGATWSYPKTIFQNLKTAIDPSYSSGFLQSASCNKSTASTICIATGNFCSGDSCTIQLPLLALSQNKGADWSYPSVIFKNLQASIDPDFSGGDLISSACTGTGSQSICIAVGQFFKSDFNPNPLLALTRTAGSTWSYPSVIFTNLPAQIGHGYLGGTFKGASCAGEGKRARCVAVGFFNTPKGTDLPLVALTKDGGQTWTYPPFFYTKLKTTVDPHTRRASFSSASCINANKQSICVIAGKYCPDRFCSRSFPLLAVTRDGGKTWNYPSSVFKNLNSLIDPQLTQAFFSDVSCSGTDEASFCVASGQYNTPGQTFPLAAYSTDNGATWTYPTYIFQNLTTSINPNFASGLFNNAGSTGQGFSEKIIHFTPISFYQNKQSQLNGA